MGSRGRRGAIRTSSSGTLPTTPANVRLLSIPTDLTPDYEQRHRAELLLLVSALVLLAVSAVPAQHGEISGAERHVFRWVNDLPDALYWPTAVVMQAGNVVAVLVAALLALAFRRYRLAIGLAVAGLGAYVVARAVKDVVQRGRPGDLLDQLHQRGGHVGGFGYVSGHAAVAFAVVTVATMWLGPRARIVTWGVAVAVAFARVYVGAHLPLDVVGGAAVGVACGAAVRILIGARRHGATRPSPKANDSLSSPRSHVGSVPAAEHPREAAG